MTTKSAGDEGRTEQRRGRRRLIAVVATPLAVLISGALVWNSSYAAFSAQISNGGNSWSTGSVVLSGDDGSSSPTATVGTAMFTATALKPGSTGTNCVHVTYSGSLAASVKVYVATGGLTGSAPLAGQINFTVVEGTGGVFNNCSGFVAGTTIYNGTLANLAATKTDFASGVGTWAPTNGQSKTYQITYTLSASAPNTVQATSAAAVVTWEADNT
jgi:hypothetical protein